MKRIISIILVISLVLIGSVSFAEVKGWSTMKNFKVKLSDGSTFDLYKVLEEKDLVLIDLWYIDCIFCPAASASIQLVYDQYKDRVAFLSVNPYDNPNAIKLFEEARGFTIPYVKYGGGASWTQYYPWFLLIDKDATVIYSWNGTDDPYELEALLDWGLSLTQEKKEWYISENVIAGASGKEKKEAADPIEKKQRKAYVKGAFFAYNLKNDMSLDVAGESVSRIVFDTNLDILKFVELTGDFYIVPEGTPFSVTVKTEKGFKPGKAFMTAVNFSSAGAFAFNNGWGNVGEDVPFKKAKKEKNDYTFELVGEYANTFYYFLESGDLESVTKDSIVGLHTFSSKEEAEDYFNKCAEVFGYEFKWHVE